MMYTQNYAVLKGVAFGFEYMVGYLCSCFMYAILLEHTSPIERMLKT